MVKIPIDDLKEILPYKDVRAIRKWCEKHNVYVFDKGKKTESVSETEFEIEYDKGFISHLKKKYGEDWNSAYRLFKDGNIEHLCTLNNAGVSQKFYKKINSKNQSIQKIQNQLYQYAETT